MKYFQSVKEESAFFWEVIWELRKADIQESLTVEGSSFGITDGSDMFLILAMRFGFAIFLNHNSEKISFLKRYKVNKYVLVADRSLSIEDFANFEEYLKTVYVEVDAGSMNYYMDTDGEIPMGILHTLGGDLGAEVDQARKAGIVITNVEAVGRRHLAQKKAVFLVASGRLYFNPNGSTSYPQFNRFPLFA